MCPLVAIPMALLLSYARLTKRSALSHVPHARPQVRWDHQQVGWELV